VIAPPVPPPESDVPLSVPNVVDSRGKLGGVV